jgi:hypothetical protein
MIRDKLEALINKAHSVGIRLPYLRDPLKGTPSVSLTMLFISFHIYILSMVNKWAGWFENVDGAFELLVLTASLYFGRSFSGKHTTSKEEK